MIPRNLRGKLAAVLPLKEPLPDGTSVQFSSVASPKGRVLQQRPWMFHRNVRALMLLDCPRRGCLDGGFDIEPMVRGAVRCRDTKLVASLTCGGRRSGADSFRLQRCACELELEVAIGYDDVD